MARYFTDVDQCNLAALVYNPIVARPHAIPRDLKPGRRLWDPLRDFFGFRERSRRGELTLLQWLRSVAHRQTFPVFRWTDPQPGWARALRMLRSTPRKRAHGAASRVIRPAPALEIPTTAVPLVRS